MKSVKIINSILQCILSIYSAMSLITFFMAICCNAVNWNSEDIGAYIILIIVCCILSIFLFLNNKLIKYYEDLTNLMKVRRGCDAQRIDRLQNKLNENHNVLDILINKKVSILYISLSADYKRYNEYIDSRVQKELNKEEFDLIKNYYCEYVEE